jgi:hypothetical protein
MHLLHVKATDTKQQAYADKLALDTVAQDELQHMQPHHKLLQQQQHVL